MYLYSETQNGIVTHYYKGPYGQYSVIGGPGPTKPRPTSYTERV